MNSILRKVKYIISFLIVFGVLSCSVKQQAVLLNDIDSKHVDLFIWAGQSNAQGWMGDAKFYPLDVAKVDKNIFMNYTFIDNTSSARKWVSIGAQNGRFALGHFGPEISFARGMKKAGYKPFIFKYTKGGTSIYNNWKLPGERGMYDAMVKDLRRAVSLLEKMGYSVNFKGFIWIQGESDAENNIMSVAYENNLTQLITDLRKITNNPKLEVILGVDEQHPWVVKRPLLVEAQKKIAASDPHINYTSMIGLPKADATHLTPEGLVSHGQIICEALKNNLKCNQDDRLQ